MVLPSTIPARYYAFELTRDTHVTINLADGATGSGPDPFLVLWEAEWSDDPQRIKFPVLRALDITNDDSDEEYMRTNPTKDSRLAPALATGTYAIEATLARAVSTSNTAMDFTLEVAVAELIPYLGHQADFTVRYRVGKMPATYTPTPTPTPFIGPVVPPGTPLPDPGVVIPTAIPLAAGAWNNAVATPWPHVFFCEKDTGDCDTKNTDGNTVVVDVVDGGVDKTAKTWNPTNSSCGHGTACVKPNPILASLNLNPPGNGHMGNLSMLIEEPAWLGEKRAV